MSARIRFLRSPYGLTTLELCGPDFDLELKLISRLGKRERRVIVKGFLSTLKPWIRYFSDGTLAGTETKTRPIRLPICVNEPLGGPPPGSPGYEIRIKRARLGLTQTDLALQIGVSRPHLSAIERGKSIPRASTFKALHEFLRTPIRTLHEGELHEGELHGAD